MVGTDAAGPPSAGELLEELLDRYPDAVVDAMSPLGVIVPLPPGIRLRGQQQYGGVSGVDLFLAEDVSDLILLFVQAMAEGSSQATLRLAAEPHVVMTVHVLDVRDEHGVLIGLSYPAVGPEEPGRAPAPLPTAALRPRFGRLRRDQLGVTRWADRDAAALLGRSEQELVGCRLLELLHPADYDLAVRSWVETLASHGLLRRSRLRCRLPDDSWLWLDVTNQNLLADPAHGYIRTDLIDVSQEMAAGEQIRASQELLQRLAEAVPVGLLHLDLGQQVVYLNDRLLELVDRPRAADARSQLAAVAAVDRPRVELAVEQVLTGVDSTVEIRIDTRTAGQRHGQLALRALRDAGGEVNGAIACLSDTTESVRLREELHIRATVDPLTSCANRATVLLQLADTLRVADGSGTAAVFVDLDSFKAVNDRYGHQAGDALLRATAERLRGALLPGELLGRMGGDEFLVVCPQMTDPVAALQHAEQLRVALDGEVALADGPDVLLCGSVGVAWAVRTTVDRLVDQADAAMYRAKAAPGRAVLYTPDRAVGHPARVRRPPRPAS